MTNNRLLPLEERKYVAFKVPHPKKEAMTQAEFAGRMREQVKDQAGKAIEELRRQYDAAASPKRKNKLEARIREWLKLLGVVARDELAIKAKQDELTGEKGGNNVETDKQTV